MLGSFDIGSVFGIRLRLHWTFVALITVLMLVGWPFPPLYNAIGATFLFGIVLLHELGHGVVARHFGLQVLDVTLLPLGGMTRMSRMPEDSKVEGLIAFAGPAVNLVLGLAALPFAPAGVLTQGLAVVHNGTPPLQAAAAVVVVLNLSLALFNLLPAFPLDGGRILRALLALRSDWTTATLRTAAVGKWIALAIITYGLYAMIELESGSIVLPLLGVFIWFSGVRESWTVRLRHAGNEFARRMGVPVPPPVVPVEVSRTVEATSDDPSGARRPSVLRPPESARGERLSEAEIAALERFRGRIGRAQAPE